MNFKRLVIAILVVWAGVFITDWLIHGLWLQRDYEATMALWRSETEMREHMGWMTAGQFLAALLFTLLYALGFAHKRCPGYAGLYGLAMGAFLQANTLIMYAVQPIPLSLTGKWILAGCGQGACLGLLVYLVYRPWTEKSSPPQAA